MGFFYQPCVCKWRSIRWVVATLTFRLLLWWMVNFLSKIFEIAIAWVLLDYIYNLLELSTTGLRDHRSIYNGTWLLNQNCRCSYSSATWTPALCSDSSSRTIASTAFRNTFLNLELILRVCILKTHCLYLLSHKRCCILRIILCWCRRRLLFRNWVNRWLICRFYICRKWLEPNFTCPIWSLLQNFEIDLRAFTWVI